ncbi:MAG TPA: high-potential iron-sulfur protein [Steroidobacteraceae bacterium]|nr:high-potential iron-sulfur protein [Steroidobacteraceae bacterium]
MTAPMTRRRLLRVSAISATAVPLAALFTRTARGADAPLIAPTDPAAVAVKYVEDAAQAKSAESGSNCANCALYDGGPDSTQGPCSVFGGKQVKAAGWCTAWTSL